VKLPDTPTACAAMTIAKAAAEIQVVCAGTKLEALVSSLTRSPAFPQAR
jgi:hypothetical protein